MVKLKRVLERIEFEKEELKSRRLTIPSQLSKSEKAQERKEIGLAQLGLTKKGKEVKQKIKKQDISRKQIRRKLEKLAKKKVVSRRILKKSKTTLHLKQVEVPSILAEPNRFFKAEWEEARHALFFR